MSLYCTAMPVLSCTSSLLCSCTQDIHGAGRLHSSACLSSGQFIFHSDSHQQLVCSHSRQTCRCCCCCCCFHANAKPGIALLQGATPSTTEVAANAKPAALTVSDRVQAAAQSAADAVSSQQTDASSYDKAPHQHSDARHSADSDLGDSPSSSSTPAFGSAPERAKRALMQRIGMVTNGYREDDCTCFDTTLGCTLKVRMPCLTHAVMFPFWQTAP